MDVLATSLLIELHNDSFQIVKSQVDVDSFSLKKPLDIGLLDPFRA